jgi:hypothetical protein
MPVQNAMMHSAFTGTGNNQYSIVAFIYHPAL